MPAARGALRARRAGASEFISKYGDELEMIARIEGHLLTAQGRKPVARAASAYPGIGKWQPRYDAALAKRQATLPFSGSNGEAWPDLVG